MTRAAVGGALVLRSAIALFRSAFAGPRVKLGCMALVAGLGVTASNARAQVPARSSSPGPEGGMSNEMRAEHLFRAGEKKFDSGKYAEACADFLESLRVGPKLGTLLNLALCHETIGKPATAWGEYHHGAAWAAQNGQKDRHDFAAQHALALETRLPRVLLQLPADHALDSVEVDGEPLPDARWYLPVFLDPGEHSVTISAPGKQRGTVKFRVVSSPAEQLVPVPALSDEVLVAPPPAVVPVASPSDPDRRRRIAGIATLGAGGVAVAVGVVAGILAIDKRNEIGERCASNRCTEEGAQLYRDAQGRASVATVAILVGLAAGAVGGWLLFTSRPPQPKGASRAAVGVRSRGDGAELGVGGTF